MSRDYFKYAVVALNGAAVSLLGGDLPLPLWVKAILMASGGASGAILLLSSKPGE